MRKECVVLLNIPRPELSPAERVMSISKFYDLPFPGKAPVRD